jgi:hypothetical protein
VSLAATPDPRALDVGLTIRLCHKNVIIKKKKTNRKKKTNKEKEKKN